MVGPQDTIEWFWNLDYHFLEIIDSIFFQLVLSAAGRCHSKMGNWEAALGSAEHVLTKEPKNTTAIFIKGEALFNLCDFEHALLHFTRGQVRSMRYIFNYLHTLEGKKISVKLLTRHLKVGMYLFIFYTLSFKFIYFPNEMDKLTKIYLSFP